MCVCMKYIYLLQQHNYIYYCFLGLRVDDSTQYYYGNFRFHFRNRWPERSLNHCLSSMQAIEEEERLQCVKRWLVTSQQNERVI